MKSRSLKLHKLITQKYQCHLKKMCKTAKLAQKARLKLFIKVLKKSCKKIRALKSNLAYKYF